MPVIGIHHVRRAMMTRLRADADLTALVGASVHGQVAVEPEWPFVRMGVPSAVPLRAACLDGATISWPVDSFAKHRLMGGQVVETAEDHASRIELAVRRALSGHRLSLEPGGLARVTDTGCELRMDGAEADAFHATTNFRVRVFA